MKTAVCQIIKRALGLPESFSVYDLRQSRSGNGNFEIDVYIEGATYFLSSENPFTTIKFENENIKVLSEGTSYLFDEISLINEKIKKIKRECLEDKKIICKEVSKISMPLDSLCNMAIEEAENIFRLEYTIKIVQIQNFKINKHDSNILQKINDMVIEYFIRDYVFYTTGFVIEHGIDDFIRCFRATNCKEPFSENYSIKDDDINFSNEFKEFIRFDTKDEMDSVIELLKLNFAI